METLPNENVALDHGLRAHRGFTETAKEQEVVDTVFRKEIMLGDHGSSDAFPHGVDRLTIENEPVTS